MSPYPFFIGSDGFTKQAAWFHVYAINRICVGVRGLKEARIAWAVTDDFGNLVEVA